MLDPSSIIDLILYESGSISVQYTFYPKLELCIAPPKIAFPNLFVKNSKNRGFQFEYENYEKFRKLTSIFRAFLFPVLFGNSAGTKKQFLNILAFFGGYFE